ncbi:MmcB family DNA repair protein [Labrys sp. KB_33_2]|uniref:MmcB family DNA repair protein n=1 Tax=Labrys sp. KB_33_2 TaxID=3237479 RepID=UPI003F9325B4
MMSGLPVLPLDGRQSAAALTIQRGASRLLRQYGLTPVPEVTLPNGRRADLLAVGRKGEIWIVEIKSSVIDFQVDHKWPDYLTYCDRLFFAVGPDFPLALLPEEAGSIVADAYGGTLLRDAPEQRLAAPTRKVLTLQLARLAAGRLHQAMDPEGAFGFGE